jgi:hypothetical protein
VLHTDLVGLEGVRDHAGIVAIDDRNVEGVPLECDRGERSNRRKNYFPGIDFHADLEVTRPR